MISIDIDIAFAQMNAKRAKEGLEKITAQDLAGRIGINPENLSRLKNGHFNAIKRKTLDALCRELGCQPGDLLRFQKD